MNKIQESLNEIMKIDAEHASVDFSLLVISTLIKDIAKGVPSCEFNEFAKEITGEIYEIQQRQDEETYMRRYEV